MKKKLLLITLAILLITTGAWATGKRWMKQSISYSTSTLAVTGGGLFHGIMFSTDSANSLTVNIYDNTAASGTKMIPTDTEITTSSSDRIQALGFTPPVPFYTGLYINISHTSVAYMIWWEIW